jgi:ABC-2 type transport system ATP-binding protein
MRILLDGLSVKRGRYQVITDITAVFEGPVDVILGLNGVGKSTLLQALCGVLRSTGSIVFDETPLNAKTLKAHKQKIGYAPQSARWPTTMTVRSFLRYVARMRAVPPELLESRVVTALNLAGLGAKEHERIEKLSGGQRRRLSLAQALLHEPEVLVLDEPTSELDPLFAAGFTETLHNLSKGHHIIVTTQSLEDTYNWHGINHVLTSNRIVTVDNTEDNESTFEGFSERLRSYMSELQ